MTTEYFSHVRAVSVRFDLSSRHLVPAEVTARLGLAPSWANAVGDPCALGCSGKIGTWQSGSWTLDSSALTDSKDVKDHVRRLLAVLLPVREEIASIVAGGSSCSFSVLMDSYHEFGCDWTLDIDCIRGIEALGASIHFSRCTLSVSGG